MKTLFVSLAMLVASVTQAAPGPECEFPGLTLPENARVFVAGGYGGRKLGFQIDQSGQEATGFELQVHSPDAPVVLMLGAYEPTVWNIRWTPNTRIVAVFASGYHRQAVAGLDSTVPLIISTYDNQNPCGYFYVGSDKASNYSQRSRKLFGRDATQVFLTDKRIKDGRIVVGEKSFSLHDLKTSPNTPPDSFKDRHAPLAGIPGLEDAVRKGILRPATRADANAWERAMSLPPRNLRQREDTVLTQQYVVLKPFTYPAGLYGAHSATFFIPRGVPVPGGDPGHSSVNDYNKLRCTGPACQKTPDRVRAPAPPVVDSQPARPQGAAAEWGNQQARPAVLNLELALETGAIRLATRADADAWLQAQPAYPRPRTLNAYVVLKPISFPAGSSTEDAATFFVPRGVPAPVGDRGLATVYDHNTQRCQGPRCR